MATHGASWSLLPPEIQNIIIHLLLAVGGRCSQLATVCRAWQSIILTGPRLADLNSQAILFRKRSQVRYIWFRVELKQYDCRHCANTDREFGLDNVDNQSIVDAFESLFKILSAWEPRGDLVLDISVYSPSDNQHWFKYLNFCSDTNLGDCPSRHEHEQGATLITDLAHGWVAGKQPVALANMLTRFPNMKELCYEPWREWCSMERHTDERKCLLDGNLVDAAADQPETGNQTLIESFPQTKLCKLTIFENFNEAYPATYMDASAIRVPNPAVSQKLARASLHLTMLSASFMADAEPFFAARQSSWKWDKLTSLALTSRVLTNDAGPSDINNLLRAAAAAALKMPRLDTMELWNGRRGVAMLFRYQRAHDGRPATITVRGTSELALGTTVTHAWDAVLTNTAMERSSSHGDAILQLGLLTEVVRVVSLRQILSEHMCRA
ncbi:hypothetical protein LLEC1_02772 [Akanthomyces lecanii]|uniref:DUF6546 domain-containing protein n=1 Tax=Cordyceps confragosa TaxID=2714763 RepID=A0A179I793_CORDF|nr:hypothetical protein LLEC1_02772 [Akanthomyces lecanii]